MTRLTAFLLGIGVLVSPIGQSVAQEAPVIVIDDVTVIDVDLGERVENRTVVVSGNRIASVRPASGADAPPGARVLDGRGKFLIPGLWEMHAHAFEHYGIDYDFSMDMYKLFLAHGVTGVRDMGSYLGQLLAGKRRIASENLPAPRIVASGPFLETAQARRFGPEHMIYTPEEARSAVDSLVAGGIDFLKIHNGLTSEVYHAAVEQARRHHLVFSGHVPQSITIMDASDSGMRSVEHLMALGRACRDDEPTGRGESETPIELNEPACRAAIEHLAANGTFITPTMIFSAELAVDSPGVSRERLQYLKPAKAEYYRPPPIYAGEADRNLHEFNQRLLRLVVEGGVTILAGTDTGAFYRLPGFALHDELALMVEAGLSPLDALRAATLNPALYFDRRGDLGAIEAGKLADLVLLDADPLEDIANTTRISAVIADGELYDEAAIEGLLSDVLASSRRLL